MNATLDQIEQHPVLIIALGALLLLAVIVLGRRIEVQIGGLHAELKPNGGSSLRDAVDRVESKADRAVSRAEEAATAAHFAATSAAKALERIEALEVARPATVASDGGSFTNG